MYLKNPKQGSLLLKALHALEAYTVLFLFLFLPCVFLNNGSVKKKKVSCVRLDHILIWGEF